jgi:hypothetical protein
MNFGASVESRGVNVPKGSCSEKGRTRLRVIPRGFLVEVQERVKRYQDLRRVRTRLVAIHRQMLRVLDEMEAMRREELPASDKKGSSKGE